MRKVTLDEDDSLQVFVTDGRGVEVEATPEQVERWERVASEYATAQREMRAIMDAAAAQAKGDHADA